MIPDSSIKDRADFENNMRSLEEYAGETDEDWFFKDHEGNYKNPAVRNRWEGWQAPKPVQSEPVTLDEIIKAFARIRIRLSEVEDYAMTFTVTPNQLLALVNEFTQPTIQTQITRERIINIIEEETWGDYGGEVQDIGKAADLIIAELSQNV